MTGGFSNPLVHPLLYGMLNHIPGEVILMSVVAGNGRGEAPEFALPLGDSFEYPTSEGVPTLEWCANLYFSEDNQFKEEDALWKPVFPTLMEEIRLFKSKPKLIPRAEVVDHARENPFETSGKEVDESEVVFTLAPVPPPLPPLDIPLDLAPADAPPVKVEPPKPAPRSKIVSVTMESGVLKKDESRKRMPDLADVVREKYETTSITSGSVLQPGLKSQVSSWWNSDEFQEMARRSGFLTNPYANWRGRGSHMAMAFSESRPPPDKFSTPVVTIPQLDEALGHAGYSGSTIKEACRKTGLFVSGLTGEEVVSAVPLETSDPLIAEQTKVQVRENIDAAHTATRHSLQVLPLVKRAQGPPAKPPAKYAVLNLPPLKPILEQGLAPVRQAFQILTRNGYDPKWRNEVREEAEVQSVYTTLTLRTKSGAEFDAVSCLGPNGKENQKDISVLISGYANQGQPLPRSKASQKHRERLKRKKEREKLDANLDRLESTKTTAAEKQRAALLRQIEDKAKEPLFESESWADTPDVDWALEGTMKYYGERVFEVFTSPENKENMFRWHTSKLDLHKELDPIIKHDPLFLTLREREKPAAFAWRVKSALRVLNRLKDPHRMEFEPPYRTFDRTADTKNATSKEETNHDRKCLNNGKPSTSAQSGAATKSPSTKTSRGRRRSNRQH